MRTITAEALAAVLQGDEVPLILDVRLADDYEAARLPGALNNCVFEVVFADRLDKQLPDKGQPIVIYGADAHSQEAHVAAEKLERAGYTDLTLLRGGIAGWQVGGYPVEEGKSLPPEPAPPEGRRELDLEKCRVEWLGRNLLSKHFGTVDLSAGHLNFHDGRLAGGAMTFDLRSLKSTNLAGSAEHDILIRHLQSHDFLDVERYPEGQLVIRHAEPLDRRPGTPNLDIRAELTLRGVTAPIEFKAVSGFDPEGRPAAQAAFTIDRTRWGILYGSGRFFHRLAGHLVNDQVEFQARIVCR